MYVVLVGHKSLEAMNDLSLAIHLKFPDEKFSFDGSEEKGYKFKIEGVGDEKAPRKFAESYLKTWKPKPVEPEVKIINLPVVEKQVKQVIPVKMPNMDAMLKSILPKGK